MRHFLVVIFVLVVVGYILYCAKESPSPPDDGTPVLRTDRYRGSDKYTHVLPACTSELFRNYYKSFGYFPSDGEWTNRDHGIPPMLSVFIPKMCRFRWPSLPSDILGKCLKEKKIRYIMTIGDSNGAEYFVALLTHAKKVYNECNMVKSEQRLSGGFVVDLAYFSHNKSHHVSDISSQDLSSTRSCRSCYSRSFICISPKTVAPAALTLEHISASSLWNRQNLDSTDTTKAEPGTSSNNLQAFVFNDYIREYFPDILIIFPPFGHEKVRANLTEIGQDLKRLHGIVEGVRPRSNSVFWIPNFTEFEHRRWGRSARYKNRRYGGLTASQVIDKLNHVLFNELADSLLKENSGVFAFFDLFNVSATMDKWSTDGVHMIAMWYLKMMGYLLQMFCSST